MARVIPTFTEENIDARTPMPFTCEAGLRDGSIPGDAAQTTKTQAAQEYRANIEEHTHRGFPLSAWVEGARMIFPTPETVAVRNADV